MWKICRMTRKQTASSARTVRSWCIYTTATGKAKTDIPLPNRTISVKAVQAVHTVRSVSRANMRIGKSPFPRPLQDRNGKRRSGSIHRREYSFVLTDPYRWKEHLVLSRKITASEGFSHVGNGRRRHSFSFWHLRTISVNFAIELKLDDLACLYLMWKQLDLTNICLLVHKKDGFSPPLALCAFLFCLI